MTPREEKPREVFICRACGFASPKWLGRCPECSTWNSLQPGVQPRRGRAGLHHAEPAAAALLSEVQVLSSGRHSTCMRELDTVLGGGLVPGSLVLVGGDPGIGKSTLVMQAAARLAENSVKVLYVSGEESASQVKLRADRLGPAPAGLYLLCETALDRILDAARKLAPDVMIVDSIQTLAHPDVGSVPGSAGQVRECGAAFMQLAKSNGPAVILVGHVTKEGLLAGPKLLEHLVDTVIYFEGDRHHGFRLLRAVKNRFGSTQEVGVFEMQGRGLVEVGDPSRLFLQERRTEAAGSAVAACLEGTRPLLLEVQALVAPTHFGLPQRRVSGLDYNRSCLLLAVLERRAGIALGSQDVFLSVAGGVSIDEPAADLAVILAVASSCRDRALAADLVCFGEVGLGGEIRAVAQPERRLREAAHLGFKRGLVPAGDWKKLEDLHIMELVPVDQVSAALKQGLAEVQSNRQ